MNWEEMITQTAARANMAPPEARRILDAFFDALTDSLCVEDKVSLRPDFGSFSIHEKGGVVTGGGRGSVNKVKRIPVFKKSPELERKLRQSEEAYVDMLRSLGRSAQAERIQRKPTGGRGG